ncbi:MAG: hypothetical protein IJO04_05095 [Oscillospiraceae bacterium]|nr:hypothetical protein [Oscillospiraceae bacterium]
MNWKQESKEELREYEAKKMALESIPADIAQLRSEMSRLGGSNSSAPVKGGGSRWEDRQINLIVKCDKLETSLTYARNWVEKVERGLSVLSPEEVMILDRFYIHPAKGNVDRLCGDLHLEKSAVYDRKDAALRRYTLARYGCAEI